MASLLPCFITLLSACKVSVIPWSVVEQKEIVFVIHFIQAMALFWMF